MKKKFLSAIVFSLLSVFCFSFTAIGGVIPDTGQTSCFDSTGNFIDCTGTGQDGEYQINTPSYTDNDNGTITDNRTGLVWQKQSDGQLYNWYEATGDNGFMGEYHNPEHKNPCGNLVLGGYDDWRLPKIRELVTIGPYSNSYPFSAPGQSDPLKNNHIYWSSTMLSGWGMDAWAMLTSGYYFWSSTPSSMNVICVRGKELTQTLVDNGDETVSDYSSGLMWHKNDSGTGNWDQALSTCNDLNLAGKNDWRLPNVKELSSLVDFEKRYPAINKDNFPTASNSSYWSSTSYEEYVGIYNPSYAWFVNSGLGYAFFGYNGDNKLTQKPFRCVRTATAPKKKYHWLITIDGMDILSSFVYDFIYPDQPTINLYQSIPSDWKNDFYRKNGIIAALSWSRDIYKTTEAVEKLYQLIIQFNNRDEEVSILSHSWGTLIAYTAIKKHPDIKVRELITLGSPLSSYRPDVFTASQTYLYSQGILLVEKPSNLKNWSNYWTTCDSISAPIPKLPRKSNLQNTQDYPNLFECHSSYFKDPEKWKFILRNAAQ